MGRSPLDHPRLAVIDKKLDAGELDEAQHLLSQLGDNYFFRHATTYLASRLLFLRGTLDEAGLVERLNRVLTETHDFPEAEALLARAKSGTLARASAARSSRPPPVPLGSQPPGADVEIAFAGRQLPEDRRRLEQPEIPRAGRVPDVGMPARPERPASIPDLLPGGAPPPGFSAEAGAKKPPRTEPEEILRLSERTRDPQLSAYSSAPGVSEQIALARKSTAPRPASQTTGSKPVRSRTEPIIGSEPPAATKEAASLFEIAGLLDAGKPTEALSLLAQRGAPDEPDHALLMARALARAGRHAEAKELAKRLAAAPLLEPTIRAGVARLALELDDVELGLEQAERAHEEDPTHATIRLTYAWAALRRARRTAEASLVSRASLALRELVGDGGPHEGLLLGLRACVEAHAGDAVRAFRLAERSVAFEPSADGFAALAMAAARLGRADEAKRAITGLREKSASEAAALAASLDAHGDGLFALGARPDSIYAPAGSAALESASLWGPLELAVIEGHWKDAWGTFAQLASDTLAQVSSGTRHEPPALAAVAAAFATIAPVSRDLAPYDQTPWSLLRLADLLALFSRGATGVDLDHPLVTLLGTYVGETLRLATAGRWHGPADDPAARELASDRGSWRPFVMVAAALAGKSDVGAAAEALEAEASQRQLASHLPAVTPICPWDPAQWPAPSRLPHYAAALQRSVVSILCAERTGGGLDGTLASLNALDEHLERIAPREAPPPPDARWARRATVLFGAYLGEVLRRETGADWTRKDGLELGPASYRLVLPSRREAFPVEHVFARLSAKAIPLHEWALRFL